MQKKKMRSLTYVVHKQHVLPHRDTKNIPVGLSLSVFIGSPYIRVMQGSREQVISKRKRSFVVN